MSSANTPKTIELSGHGLQIEALALAPITPGMLIERAPNGIQPHSVPGGAANLTFAVESGMTGGTIETDYEVDENVFFKAFAPGSHLYALLADGEDVAEGSLLVSSGDGTLSELVEATGGVVVAQALEAVATAGSTDALPARIRVEVMAATYVAPTP